MARITVEDCLDNVENRFELVLVATKRARQIALGAEPMVTYDKDKPTVIALREIAEGLVTNEILDEPDTPVLDFGEEFTELAADADISFDMGSDTGLAADSANEDADASTPVAAAESDEAASAEQTNETPDKEADAAEELTADMSIEDFSAALDAALKEELKPDGDTSPAEDSTE